MKGFFYSIIYMFLIMFLSTLFIKYVVLEMKYMNDKDDLWKETLYYGSNKSYFRTLGDTPETNEDNLTLENLYSFQPDDAIGGEEISYIQIQEELGKDVNYFLNYSDDDYVIKAVDGEEGGNCKFNIYISRRHHGSTDFNTIKAGLCTREE